MQLSSPILVQSNQTWQELKSSLKCLLDKHLIKFTIVKILKPLNVNDHPKCSLESLNNKLWVYLSWSRQAKSKETQFDMFSR